MAATGTAPITPQGIRDGDPPVLAALAARRGPAVLAFTEAACDPTLAVRAAADAFARFRVLVADPTTDTSIHPDALLLRCTRLAALDLARPGPDLGCGPATELLAARAFGVLPPRDEAMLARHLKSCDRCRDLVAAVEAGDRAYREAEEREIEPSALAPMVAALAAAAPVAAAPIPVAPAPPEPVAVEEAAPPAAEEEPEPATQEEPEPAAEEEPEPLAEEEPEPLAEEGPVLPAPATGGQSPDGAAEDEPEPLAEEEPEPAAEAAILPTPAPTGRTPDGSEEDLEDEDERPLGTRRLTGSPASYYELPAPPPRGNRRAARRAAQGAVAASGAAAALGRRAGEAARKRLAPEARKPQPAPEPEAMEPTHVSEPEAETGSWARVDSIEFPAVRDLPGDDEDLHAPDVPPEPELERTAARAAARHYRRLRHRRQEQERLPADGRPPRLPRPRRDRGTHLPLSAHGPRDLALPAGLVVLAVMLVLAVSGVFGGSSGTPATGTGAEAPPEAALVTQSATSISLEAAERIVEQTGAAP